MGTWTNFPMPAGQYCTRDVKYIEELYGRFTEIEVLHNIDTILYDPNRYTTTWKLYVSDRGEYTENAIKYLRNRIEGGLLTWWFWNDGARPFFVHAVKADVLNDDLGQADWTNEDFIKLGTLTTQPLLDELYKVIDWIAKNIYVRRRTYGTKTNGYSVSFFNGDYGTVGNISPWSAARIAFTGQVGDVCDDEPNNALGNASWWHRPFAFTVLWRQRNAPDYWRTAFTATGDYTIGILYNVTLLIREDLWPAALKDTSEIKMWWGGDLTWSNFILFEPPLPPPSPFLASNWGYIAAPVKIDGVLQDIVNNGGDATRQDQYINVTPGDFDFTTGTDLVYDLDELDLKAQLFVPPDIFSDVLSWQFPFDYVEGDTVLWPVSTVYRCILDHTSSTATEPGSGIDWETYWVRAPEPGWYRGDYPDDPAPDYTYSEYGWSIGILQGFMIRPAFSWI